METLHLSLPIPPSNNNYKRHFCTGRVNGKTGQHVVSAMLTKKASAFKNEAGWTAKAQGARVSEEELRVDILVFSGDPTKGKSEVDIDNVPKVLFDALEHIVWENDRQIQDMRVRRMPGYYTDPHIEVTIMAIPREEAEDGVSSTEQVPGAQSPDYGDGRRGR